MRYTDVYYSSYEFDENNGWMILDYWVNQDGTYDIEIISTGIPAGYIYIIIQI